MTQNIPFKKDVLFKTKVAEIEKIHLSEKIINRGPGIVSGEFNLTGTYKMHMASRLSEEFEFSMPFDIALDDRHDHEAIALRITNFRYEIIDNEILRAFIDVELDGLIEEPNHEVVNIETEAEERVEAAIPEFEEEPNIIVENEVNINIETPESDEEEHNITAEVNTIFNNLTETDETYSTYNVYTMGESDSLENVIAKYQTDIDTLARYNQIDQVRAGDKLIFPLKSQNE